MNIRHGQCRGGVLTSEYVSWACMVQRCTNSKNKEYDNYGGRGITVCKRWLWFTNFFEDMGVKPTPKHTLERKNNERGYNPRNCKWATIKEQANNRRRRTDVHAASGVKGVYRNRLSNKWYVQIFLSGKIKSLGTFTQKSEAEKAYKAAAGRAS